MNPIAKLAKRTARKLGFEISRLSENEVQTAFLEYTKITPWATYSPWNKDDLFSEAYSSIKQFTLVDKYRCFELWKLVEQSSKLQEGALIEIGVWQGGTGALIAKQALLCGIEEPVYLCDTFSGVVKAGVQDTSYEGGEHSDTSRRIVEEFVFDRMNLTNVKILEGIFPDETGHEVEATRFRFCHIDVDVYRSAKDIDMWIWDRVVPNGIVVYDDYGFSSCRGIAKYVDEQMLYRDRLIFHNLNGHAIVVKL